MMLFRSAHENDLEEIYKLSSLCGFGLTTLPHDREILRNRLLSSSQSFAKNNDSLENGYYLFVLEDTDNGQIVGTSGIEASIGLESPFYSYKLTKHTRVCHSLGIRNNYEVLSLVNDYQGFSEICTLFLAPKYRHKHNGLLLSLARFLFIASFPRRFATTIIAEMRGKASETGESPFWENLGRHFFHMPFTRADYLTMATNKQFIGDLMPRKSIYVPLLAQEAQDVIAKPHQSSLSAMNMLMQEGFRYNGYVDIFDAGPTLEAPCNQISSIKNSKLLAVSDSKNNDPNQSFIIANNKLDFKATIGDAFIHNETYCSVDPSTLQLLNIHKEDLVRITPIMRPA